MHKASIMFGTRERMKTKKMRLRLTPCPRSTNGQTCHSAISFWNFGVEKSQKVVDKVMRKPDAI